MPEQEPPARSVPADAVLNTLVQSGAVSDAEVQLAAELVITRMEIAELKAGAEQQQGDAQPKGGRPEK